MKRLDERKVMRDPIHEYIHVDNDVIWASINAPEFQRLRRIHQLGPTYMVYHTAEHSRFSHSLGVYEIVRRMIDEVKGLKEQLTEFDQLAVMLAGLLHDLGHGPFSHAFEWISPKNHEFYTEQLLKSDSVIHEILVKEHPGLPYAVADIIGHRYHNPLCTQMISGQLDADRMDYLLRDAYFTGTSYGQFDLERVLRTMRVKERRLVIKESGIHTVEDYIMARYHMYWQVYYHPVSRSFEALLSQFFHRLKDMYHQSPLSVDSLHMFEPYLKNSEVTNQDVQNMDEAACLYGFMLATHHPDTILSDLAKRLLNRHLFEYKDIESEEQILQVKKNIELCGFDPSYYFWVDTQRQKPYQPYQGKESSLIWILRNNGEVKELSEMSVIVKAIVHGENKQDRKMFYPKECEV